MAATLVVSPKMALNPRSRWRLWYSEAGSNRGAGVPFYQHADTDETSWIQPAEGVFEREDCPAVSVKHEPQGNHEGNSHPMEVDPDCYVVDAPGDRRSLAVVPPSSPLNAGDDLVVTGQSREDPSLLFPHARFDCRMPSMDFSKVGGFAYAHPSCMPTTSAALLQNRKHCERCYCYVCDMPASECRNWGESKYGEPQHCMATDSNPSWVQMRAVEKRERSDNAEGLPPWMRGLPKELVLQTPPQNYVSKIITPAVTPHQTWPRQAGYADFMLPRCIMHTHTELPDNALLSKYFHTANEHAGSHVRHVRRDGTVNAESSLLDELQRLQQAGCVQVTWEVHHADRQLSPDFTLKMQALYEKRPVTFDLGRKFTPRSNYSNPTKTFEDRPAQAEGNPSWWAAVSEFKVLRSESASTGNVYQGKPYTGYNNQSDPQLRQALAKCSSCACTKEHCCWVRATVHFEKKITELPDTSNLKSSVKKLVQEMNGLSFADDVFTPAAELASVEDGKAKLQELLDEADKDLKAGKYETAIAGYSAALSLPVRARAANADRQRKFALVGRARARLALNMSEGAADDCLNVLEVEEWGPAVLVLGRVFAAQEKFEEARAALLRALVILEGASFDDLRAEAEEQLQVVQAKLPRVAAGQPHTVTLTNMLGASVKLFCVNRGGSTVPKVQSHGSEKFSPPVRNVKFGKTLISHGRFEYSGCYGYGGYGYGGWGRKKQKKKWVPEKYKISSDPKSDLGITFVPRSCPPKVASVDLSTREQHGVQVGMVLRLTSASVSHADMMRSGSHQANTIDILRQTQPYMFYDVAGKSYTEVMAHLKRHKRPLFMSFEVPAEPGKLALGELQAYQTYHSSRPPKLTLTCSSGCKIVAKRTYGSDVEVTLGGDYKDWFLTETPAAAKKVTGEQLWSKYGKAAIDEHHQPLPSGSIGPLCLTQGDAVQAHIKWFESSKRLPKQASFADLRTLQNSRYFGLSEGYVGKDGLIRELPQNPPGLNVQLRNYQSQATQWMLDKENESVSSPFYVKFPLGVSSLRRPGDTDSVPNGEGSLMYCHINQDFVTPESLECESAAKGGILAEEMGMGKTVEVLALISLSQTKMRAWQASATDGKPRGGTLIVCPVSLFGQWKLEIKTKLSQKVTVYEYHSNRKYDKDLLTKYDVVLTTYSILNREEEGARVRKDQDKITSPLKEIEWYRAVCDEVHSIKEPSTKQAKFCMSLATTRRWAVTGTVLQTKHDDIQAILQFLRMAPFGTGGSWKRHMYGEVSVGQRGGVGPINMPILSLIMSNSIMRHIKTQEFGGEQILKLPKRYQSVRLLEYSSSERALHTELEQKALHGFNGVADVRKQTLKLTSLLLPLRMFASTPLAIENEPNTAEASASGIAILRQSEVLSKLIAAKVSAAQANATVASLSSGANCTICQDMAESPTCTPCGHIFCEECILNVVNGSSATATASATAGTTAATASSCPNCRAPVMAAKLMQLKPVSGGGDETSFMAMLKNAQQNSTKITALLASLNEMRRAEPKAKAVIFTQFRSSHKNIVATLKENGITSVQIHGAMTQKARARALATFIEDPDVCCFCLSMRSGAVGLTLTAASRCFLMEPCVNEGTELQAINRIHRMGQTREIKIITFAMKNSIEERVLQLRKERSTAAAARGNTAATAVTAAAATTTATATAATTTATAGAASTALTTTSGAADASAIDLAKESTWLAGGGANMSREVVDASLSDWQLLFNQRLTEIAIDVGDADSEAAAVSAEVERIQRGGSFEAGEALKKKPNLLSLEDRRVGKAAVAQPALNPRSRWRLRYSEAGSSRGAGVPFYQHADTDELRWTRPKEGVFEQEDPPPTVPNDSARAKKKKQLNKERAAKRLESPNGTAASAGEASQVGSTADKRYVEVTSKWASGWDGGLALVLDDSDAHQVLVKSVLDNRKYTVLREGISDVDGCNGASGSSTRRRSIGSPRGTATCGADQVLSRPHPSPKVKSQKKAPSATANNRKQASSLLPKKVEIDMKKTENTAKKEYSAIASANEDLDLVGRTIVKLFGDKQYRGTVAGSFANGRQYRVEYEDGDSEMLSKAEIQALRKSNPLAEKKKQTKKKEGVVSTRASVASSGTKAEQYVDVASKYATGWDGGLALLLGQAEAKPPFFRPAVLVKALLDNREYVVERDGITEVDEAASLTGSRRRSRNAAASAASKISSAAKAPPTDDASIAKRARLPSSQPKPQPKAGKVQQLIATAATTKTGNKRGVVDGSSALASSSKRPRQGADTSTAPKARGRVGKKTTRNKADSTKKHRKEQVDNEDEDECEICCDCCDVWYSNLAVGFSVAQAKSLAKWTCPSCKRLYCLPCLICLKNKRCPTREYPQLVTMHAFLSSARRCRRRSRSQEEQ
eukprot:COSAG05_NODE_201_length_14387_cov_59.959476_7_plen_2387_part_00